jgi:hypothetical protein
MAQRIYSYYNTAEETSHVVQFTHDPQSSRNMVGQCVGATMLFLQNYLSGKELLDTEPNYSRARNLQAVYLASLNSTSTPITMNLYRPALQEAHLLPHPTIQPYFARTARQLLWRLAIELPPGAYFVGITYPAATHAIAVIKSNDGTFLFFDANSGLYSFQNAQDFYLNAVFLLRSVDTLDDYRNYIIRVIRS